ncbi:MAG: aspartyl protease family protein [Chitinophagales bacterium]|jgi:predicted aspartyl protease|nr:aspartyl protease family protein [Chitinophagales bacterium]
MLRFIISVLLLLQVLPSLAQEEFVPPQAKLLTRFRFQQYSGGVIMLRGTLDQHTDSLNFILDTGSGGISLDSATATRLGVQMEMSDRTIRGIAGLKRVAFAYNHSLHLPGLVVEKLDFHINDYELLTSVYGIQIDGIIGYSFFRRFIVHIDFDKEMLEVYAPGSYRYPKGGYLLKPSFSTLPLPYLEVEDSRTVNARFIFDTGAAMCFLMSSDFAQDSTLMRKSRKRYLTQVEGLGGKKRMEYTIVKSLKIGPYKFRRVPAHIFEDDFNVTSYPQLGGLIGNDLLRRFNMVINYPEQSIYLKPNEHFAESFDYSYTGLGVYMVEGEIKVIDVIPGTPGHKAGFEAGDVIFAVDNNYSKNIKTLKTLLQNAGATMQVVVFRNGVPKVLTLKIGDIRRKRG